MIKPARPVRKTEGTLRLKGYLTDWNGARGFGFLKPVDGGPDAFAHISAFPKEDRHIEEGHLYTYEITEDATGRLRAADIRPEIKTSPALPSASAHTRRDWLHLLSRAPRLLVIPAFLYIAYTVSHGSPMFAQWMKIYGIASVACFIGYGLDKRAAQRKEWRISETVLILLGLVGGWPGAVLAQELFRHKTKKPAFRLLFWMSVAINVAAFLQINAYTGR